jgi:hypothetical protein
MITTPVDMTSALQIWPQLVIFSLDKLKSLPASLLVRATSEWRGLTPTVVLS